jgi:hypothetical protein
MAGISVLATIAILSLLIFFRLFVYDPLASYASADTTFYLHLNLDRQGNYYQTKIVNAVINHFQLQDLDQHELGDELAVICKKTPASNCYLVFFATNKKNTEKYFQDKKISYQTSGYKLFSVPLDGVEKQKIKRSWNPLIYLRYQGGLWKDDLTLVINQDPKPQTANQKIIAFLGSSLRLSGKIRNQGVFLTTQPFGAVKADWDSIYTDIDNPQFDLIINSIPSSGSNQLLINYLNSVSKNNSGDTFSLLAKNGFTLFMKRINNSAELLTGYQIFINSLTVPNEEELIQIKSIMTGISGQLMPSEKNIYLNDGTRVTILSTNGKITASENDQYYESPITNQQNIFLSLATSSLALGNDHNFQPKLSDTSPNYGLIRLASLPEYNPIKNLLAEFSILYFDENKIVIK